MIAPGNGDPREAGVDGGHDPRPTVALPGTGLPTPLLVLIGAVLALALFLLLNAQRQARLDEQSARTRAAVQSPPSPPPLAIPPPPPPPAPVVIYQTRPAPAPAIAMRPAPMPEPMPAPMPPPLPEPAFVPPPPRAPPGSPGPALVVDLTSGSGAAVNGGEPGGPGTSEIDDTVRATLIHNRAAVIPQGAIIAAVLETPLNSDRPGLARAIVAHDARGFDGTRVLVPRGSRLFGEFRADPSPGMRRILVNWTRLIRPDGVAIRIGSPVSDSMGGAGVPGSVNSHFLARFSSAVLQSALAVGVNLASQSAASGSNTVFLGLPSQSAQAGQQLIPNVNRAPTVKVREGAEVAVMVAHDLDFSGTPLVH